MAFNLFTGPLAMFYAGEYPGAPDQPPFDRDELRDAVLEWQRNVASGIPQVSEWTEGYGMPYLYASIGPDALGALILKIACHAIGEEMPSTIPRGWKFTESEVVDRAMSSGCDVPSFLSAEIWVPSPAVGIARLPGPHGKLVGVSTTGTLRQDLASINRDIWRASNEEISSWSDTPPQIAEPLDTEALARFAFSALCKILAASESIVQPILAVH